MNVMVTGGAGYIGSHTVKQLLELGHKVVVVDNLFRGHEKAVCEGAAFHKIGLWETEKLAEILLKNQVDCVMHFAALAYVSESVAEPLSYYENNTAGAICLLNAMKLAQVKRFIFSSTCATYGEPSSTPIAESTKQEPVNPYGWSKLCVERVLKDYGVADNEFSYVGLRYFNVAGCAADGSLGEDHSPETHLIPVALHTALQNRKKITVYGTDYGTPDGTCIRDYVHVEDLSNAHIMAMNSMKSGEGTFYNVGIGKGYSVRQVLDAIRRVTGVDFPIEYGKRRPGDPPVLYANAQKIRTKLGWSAKYTEIEPIVETAWNWFKSHPNGYSD